MDAEVAIEAVGLSCSYGSFVSLQPISFQISAGEICALVGPNGAGKTSLIRRLLGLTSGQGTSLFLGSPLTAHNVPLAVVGVVFDGVPAHPRVTARRHLSAIARGIGVPIGRVDPVLELVGLSSAADIKVGRFSLGMKQRLSVAAALLGTPRVLVLDEPGNGLDPDGLKWLQEFLSMFAANGGAVLISSHHLNDLATYATRVLVLSRGQLVSDSSVSAFLKRHGPSRVVVRVGRPLDFEGALSQLLGPTYTRFGETFEISGLELEEVAHLAADHGGLVFELREASPSIQDAFFEVINEGGQRA